MPGFLLAATSTLAGALLSFCLSRSLFRPAVETLVARRPRLRNLDALIARDGWKLVLSAANLADHAVLRDQLRA